MGEIKKYKINWGNIQELDHLKMLVRAYMPTDLPVDLEYPGKKEQVDTLIKFGIISTIVIADVDGE